MKLEELTSKVKKALGEDYVKSVFETPEMKELFEAHEKIKNIDPKDLVEKNVPHAQSARLLRAMARGDREELKAVSEEEHDKYLKYMYGIYGADIEMKALTTYLNETTGSEGAHLVPLEYYQELFEVKTSYGVARDECLIIPMTSKEMKINKYLTEPTTSWITEFVKKPVSKPAFDQIALKPEKQVCILPFTEELLADATPPLVQFLIRVTSKAFKKGEDTALWNGVGTDVCGGAGVGVLKNASVKKVTMKAGHTSFSDISFDYILELIDAVDGDMEEDGKFFMNKNVLHKLMGVKDANERYLWSPPTSLTPGTIWGYLYRKSSLLPGNAADLPNTPFMAFGNFKECVALGDRQAMAIKLLTEATIDGTNLAEYDLQALRFVSREDIEVVLPEGVSVLWTHA